MLLDRSLIPFTPGLGENDILNDCTLVALVNSVRAASWVQNGCDLAIDWNAIVAEFAELGNVAPTLTAEQTVPGLFPQDVLNYAMSHGIQAGVQSPLVLRSAQRVLLAPAALCDAMRPGAAYVEIALTAADMGPGLMDGPLPGPVVGLHQIILWDCTGLGPTDTVQIGTWGRWQSATWRGLQARAQGAWKLKWVLP